MINFVVNDFITLKLEQNETVIYVNGKRFLNCKYLLLNVPVEKMTRLEDLQSIDEISDSLDNSLEFDYELKTQKSLIPPEVEFWGHSSNLQVWYENDYNTSLIHSNLAFPLLKELTDAGDPLARKVFAEEIAKRFDSEYLPVMVYLIANNYLFYLTEDQMTSLKFFERVREICAKENSGDLKEDMFKSFLVYLKELKPKTPNEWITKAKTLKAFKLERLGEECIKEALNLFPESEQLLLGYVQILNHAEDFKNSEKILKKLTTIAPNKYIYWTGLGMVMLRQGKLVKALDYYSTSLKINPDVPVTKLQMTEAYHRSNMPRQRDKLLRELLSDKNLPFDLAYELASFCSAFGKYRYAVIALKRALLVSPVNAEAWFELGLDYRELKKDYKARRSFKKAITFSEDPKLKSEALDLLGILYAEAWFFKKAIESLIQAVKLNPQNGSAWANQTPVYAMLMDLKRAGLAIEISKKLKELNFAKERGNMDLAFELMQEVGNMQKEYWEAKFECPFCKVLLEKRPSSCPSCKGNFDEILKRK